MTSSFRAGLALALALLPAAASAQYPYPVPAYGYPFLPESDLRLAITPREAMVYVDGYLAGTVDEFDGVFQRLHLAPGEHEITFYLQGYRTISQRLYLSPNGSRKITQTMEKLADGESSGAPPVPPQPRSAADQAPDPRDRYPVPGRRPSQRPAPSDREEPAPAPAPTAPAPDSATRTASLILRVEPPGAEVLVDGETWSGPSGDERLVIQVPAGPHRIEVRKDGYVMFSSEVDVAAGASMPIDVSLPRQTR